MILVRSPKKNEMNKNSKTLKELKSQIKFLENSVK